MLYHASTYKEFCQMIDDMILAAVKLGDQHVLDGLRLIDHEARRAKTTMYEVLMSKISQRRLANGDKPLHFADYEVA